MHLYSDGRSRLVMLPQTWCSLSTLQPLPSCCSHDSRCCAPGTVRSEEWGWLSAKQSPKGWSAVKIWSEPHSRRVPTLRHVCRALLRGSLKSARPERLLSQCAAHNRWDQHISGGPVHHVQNGHPPYSGRCYGWRLATISSERYGVRVHVVPGPTDSQHHWAQLR